MEFTLVNILIAFGGGILSFVSPCVLPLIPMYLAYMTGVSVKDLETDKKPIKKAFINSLFFVFGFTIIFTVFAAIFYIIFNNLGGVRVWVDRAVALLLIVFALHVMGVITIPFLNYEARMKTETKKDPSVISSFIMGLVFGAGWTPCIGPILSGILMTATDSGNIAGAIVMLVVYSLGLGVPFILTGIATKTLLKLFKSIKKHMKAVEIVSGVFLIGVALFIAIPTFLPKSGDPQVSGQKSSDQAADFTGVDLVTGKQVALSQYKGKVVLLNFWATWCDPCREEIPALIELARKYSNDLAVIGVSIDDTSAPVIDYLKSSGISYPIIMKPEGIEQAYGDIMGVPTTYIIDKNGKQVKKFTGGRTLEQFEQLIAPYLSGGNTPQPQNTLLAPEIDAVDILTGNKVTLSQYKGKVVFVNFWATWCPPCRAEIPSLITLQTTFKDKFAIIGVSVDTTGADSVKQFSKAMGINYPVVMDSGALAEKYGGVSSIPTTVVVKPNGEVAVKIIGGKSYEAFREIVLKYSE
ncbi:MAG: hypothetical protein A2Y33_03740 [Spirochaetes bacterium GWF1_51_8]|nr:MAG: hypothetical protein A2Y33_03740 [Spirochaetes bacterium GWF1_51_8]